MVVVAIALTSFASGPSGTREVASFDFGWRHRLGATRAPKPPPPPSPPFGCSGQWAFKNASGIESQGLSSHSNARNAAECETFCCVQNGCGIWQWSNAAKGGGCWFGTGLEPTSPSHSWIGGRRNPPIRPIPPDRPLGPHPPEATKAYDDHDWSIVQAPHDALIDAAPSEELCSGGCSGRSYLPRYPSWYRKHFKLPAAWSSGSAVALTFDGVFRECTIWINGANVTTHTSGYTSFTVQLPHHLLMFGNSDENVIALFVDPDKGRSGWWYEGGGLYRHVRLERTDTIRLVPGGLFAYSNISQITADGLEAAEAVLHLEATVESTVPAAVSGIAAKFTLVGPAGEKIATVTSATAAIDAAMSTKFVAQMPSLGKVILWAPRAPTLYTVVVTVLTNGAPGDVVDRTFGFRSLYYDSTIGMKLNNQRFKWRGFCDHDNFASLGMAVPDRVKLFRAQASRSVGGNGRRTSHNAPDPVMMDIYDRVGVAVMDENRLLANTSEDEREFRDLVRRDRMHPSVVVWSFCNEAGCESSNEEAGGPRFQRAAYDLDGSRPTLANMFTYNDLLSKTIDLQGFSHQGRSKYEAAHAAMPKKPLWASECCSCNTMRGEIGSGDGLQNEFNAECQQSQTNATDGIDYAIGTTVWTLFDYYGEPSNGGWPYVSSTFGAFDLAGFAKSAVYWFRSQWLYGVADTSYDKTFETESGSMVRIVESWQPPPPPPPPPPPKNVTIASGCIEAGSPRQRIVLRTVSGGVSIVSGIGLCVDATAHGQCMLGKGENGGCYPLPFVECVAGSASQTFSLSGKSPGTLMNSVAGGCLDLFGGTGPNVGLYECNNGPNQKWTVGQDGVGAPTLTNVQSTTVCLGDAILGAAVNDHRTIHVYTEAPQVTLLKDGESVGTANGLRRGTLGGPSWATFDHVKFSPGNLTAVAMSSSNASLATHTVVTAATTPAAVVLSVDVPSAATGTGTALLLDGQDVGLVRATIVDAAGNFVPGASGVNVSFRVMSGPGIVVGAHSGDPASHEENQRPYHSSYHGLVRGVIRVTSDAASPDRGLRALIDVDAPYRDEVSAPASQIVIEASAPGLKGDTVAIAVSMDAARDSVLAAAEKYGAGVPVTGFN